MTDVHTYAPPVHDEKFCTVVLRVLPGTGQMTAPDRQSVYICAKSVPCPDHPQSYPPGQHGGER